RKVTSIRGLGSGRQLNDRGCILYRGRRLLGMAREGHRASLVEGAGRSSRCGGEPVQGAARSRRVRRRTASSPQAHTGAKLVVEPVDGPARLTRVTSHSKRFLMEWEDAV